jgi:hypothetical protein
MSDVTCILAQIESGDPQAAERLLPLVYDELRNLARRDTLAEWSRSHRESLIFFFHGPLDISETIA